MLVVALIGLVLAVLIPRQQARSAAPPSSEEAPAPAGEAPAPAGESPAPEMRGGQVT
jgi:hypothetical protein